MFFFFKNFFFSNLLPAIDDERSRSFVRSVSFDKRLKAKSITVYSREACFEVFGRQTIGRRVRPGSAFRNVRRERIGRFLTTRAYPYERFFAQNKQSKTVTRGFACLRIFRAAKISRY